MGENSKIEWTHHTFNPWRGCTKVSAGCANCYAERDSKRNPGVLGIWGSQGTRVVASEAMWAQPRKWNRQAHEAGERRRVFCASLADVFEDWWGDARDSSGNVVRSGAWCPDLGYGSYDPVTLSQIRDRLGRLIVGTPYLDWLLLTKRPENALDMMADTMFGVRPDGSVALPPNVWIGTSVEDQATADERIPHLLRIPAAQRFVSMEPLLGPVDLGAIPSGSPRCEHCGQIPTVDALAPSVGEWCECCEEGAEPLCWERIDWVIVGGESGPNARPMHPDWARDLRDRCVSQDVPFFFKQWGEWQSIDQLGPDGSDPLYRSNIVASLPHNQPVFDELYGRTCKVPSRPVDHHGGKSWGRPDDRPAYLTFRVGKQSAGRLLDGRTWDEVPA